MYSVSCTGILQVYKFNHDQGQEAAYHFVTSSLPVSLHLPVQIRSLCTTLRPFEVPSIELTPGTIPFHGHG